MKEMTGVIVGATTTKLQNIESGIGVLIAVSTYKVSVVMNGTFPFKSKIYCFLVGVFCLCMCVHAGFP